MKRAALALVLCGWLVAGTAQALPVPVLVAVQPAPPTIPTWRSWSLTNLGAALVAHWDASDLVATPVATWTDNVALVATTAIGSAQPTWSATGFVGVSGLRRPGVTCDGVANATVSTSFAALPTGTNPSEIWGLVDQQAPIGASAVIIRYGTVSTSVEMRSWGVNTPWSLGVTAANGGTQIPDRRVTFVGPHIVGGAWAGTTQSGRIDGAPMTGSPGTVGTLATTTLRLRICANIGTTANLFWAGTISDMIVTTTLTATQRQQIEGWLAWRGGSQSRLAFNHPYRSRQP